MTNRIFKLAKCIANALKASGTDIIHWDGEMTGFGVRSRKSGGQVLNILPLVKKGIDPRFSL